MWALITIAVAFQLSVGRPPAGDSTSRDARQRQAEMEARLEGGLPLRDHMPPRRVPLTDALRASAFRDPGARALLLHARAARLRQDSTLTSYDATTYQRLSIGLSAKADGRDRLAYRQEHAARVRWLRERGAFVDVQGSRAVAPLATGNGGGTNASTGWNAPLPYFPGREDLLWIGGGLTRADVNDRSFVHPLAEGAEAYYTYETGDSLLITLPDQSRITIRELRVRARRPKWNLSVGSFWFDVATGHLTRAVYRVSAPLDIWTEQRNDSSASRDKSPWLAEALLSPLRADISAVTIEYGLYGGRFWLPRAQALEGAVQVSFVRLPVTVFQRFRYAGVNMPLDSLPADTPRAPSRVAWLRDSLDRTHTTNPLRDSLLRVAVRARARELLALHARECAERGSYTTHARRYEGAVVVTSRVPCDTVMLAHAPVLPSSIYDPGEPLFNAEERATLVRALSFGLQPGWAPQTPVWHAGLPYTRYNRVEGLSTGLALTSALGLGYTAALEARGGVADRQLNGELSLSRTDGRSTVHAAVYRRLAVMNDWGTPLSFGASLGALLYARDEGAYYRAWGAEVGGTRPWLGTLDWRVFTEHQQPAAVSSRWTLFGGGNDSRFLLNPIAQTIDEYGVALRWHASQGLDPDGWRLLSDLRLEGAAGDFSYLRGLFDFTLSHPLTRRLAVAFTASGGSSGGTVPVQRLFYIGGSQTVRGQTALAASGDVFWITRAELGMGPPASRLIVFSDAGWAGDRHTWSRLSSGRPLSGVGVGTSLLDGLLRLDVARGLYPAQQWRADLLLEARF